MIRPLVAILALSFVVSDPADSIASAGRLPDGAKGRGVFRLQGGALFRDRGYSKGEGWVAGGAVGIGVTRDLMVLASMEHLGVNMTQPYRESFQPITIQIQMGAPFQHRISPRVEVGGGMYLRTRDRVVVYDYGYPYLDNRTTVPFGMNFGGGLSFLVGRTTMVDVGIHRHESFSSHEDFGMTTATAGMTFAFAGEHGVWARKEQVQGTLASR